MDINKIIEDLKDNGENTSEEDVNLYDLLYQNLNKNNRNGFSLGFSNNIIRKLEAKQQRRFNIKMYCLIVFLLLVSAPLFIVFLNNDILSLLVSVFLKYKFIALFLLSMFILIQVMDKILKSKKV